METKRTLALADLHLVPQSPPAVTRDLASLVTAHPGARILFVGDLFDLPAVLPRRPHRQSVVEAIDAHPTAREALGRHLDQGGELWLVGGNHDAEVGSSGFGDHLHTTLRASPESRARLRTSPWFLREGGLHVEHGHCYDPDNAPAHPLVDGSSSLGVHFVEQFIAPAGAHHYLNSNDGTPLKLLLASFTTYGARAPYIVYHYFNAAFRALLKSGPFYRGASEIPRGRALHAEVARDIGVDASLMDAVLAERATPTLESLSRTFARLYMDRVIATASIAGGLGAASVGLPAGGALAAFGGLLMVASWARGHDRYTGSVGELLSASAARVADATGAKLVIFGHTHREALDERYANTGSFAFPREEAGRPFLEIEGPIEAPRAVRRYLR